jgi:hypothetical protein
MNVKSNKIAELPIGVFDNNINLHNLHPTSITLILFFQFTRDLSSNGLTSIPPNTFSKLNNLDYLIDDYDDKQIQQELTMT